MKKWLILIIMFFLPVAYSQNIKSMEFHNQEITDILLVLAEAGGVSIIPDETVSGNASFYFAESSLEQALDTFLATYRLFYEKKENYIAVSKIKSEWNSASKTASIKADNVDIESIFRNLSQKTGTTVLYDSLPSSSLSLDVESLPLEEILKICVRKYPDYSVIKEDSYFYVKKNQTRSSSSSNEKKSSESLTRQGDLYSLNLERGRLKELLSDLFSRENREFSFFIQSDTSLENLYFSNKNFETMLRLILEQGNADYIEKNGIYYIVDLQKKGVTAKLKSTEIIPLKWIQVQELVSLFPSEMSSSVSFKLDKNNNAILLTGTNEETSPIRNFIQSVDVPSGGMNYKRIDVKYLDAKDLVSLIPQKMVQNQPVIIPDSNSIFVFGTEESISRLEEFIDEVDKKQSGIPVRLKYIQTEALLKNIPPSIKKDTIVESGFPNLIFYKGSEENLQLFMHELDMIDRPQPQIKYQLLVVQYSKNKKTSIKPNLIVSKSGDDANFVFSGSLSSVMDLGFDIISKFGYEFAASLNAQISDSTANVFTDTTLTGLSGQEIKFQNTDTTRYIEYDYTSSSSTTTRSSTTQQIVSGLIVNLNGWVSGDNMITMSISATVSKQNETSSSSSSSSVSELPSTSERVITTQVRTMSGEPVVISGLIKDDVSETVTRIPLLGSIPLLGHLFRQKTSSKNKTEVVIYIIPHLINDAGNNDSNLLNIERYYKNFIGLNK